MEEEVCLAEDLVGRASGAGGVASEVWAVSEAQKRVCTAKVAMVTPVEDLAACGDACAGEETETNMEVALATAFSDGGAAARP